jgi:hypothetical protein
MSWWIGPAAGLLGSLFGGGGSSAESGIADVLRQVVNALLQTYGTSVQPVMEALGPEFLATLPNPADLSKYVSQSLATLSTPYTVSPAERARANQSIIQSVQDQLAQAQDIGLSPDQLGALAQRLGEKGIEAQAGAGTQFAETEAQNRYSGAANLLSTLEGLLSGGLQYGAAGSNLTGGAMSGLTDLSKMFAGGANPWDAFTKAIGGIDWSKV